MAINVASTEFRVGWFGQLAWLLALLSIAPVAKAEQLPVRHYTIVDGLPRDSSTLVKQDSRGFIWIVVGDGITRFDGRRFINYTPDKETPQP